MPLQLARQCQEAGEFVPYDKATEGCPAMQYTTVAEPDAGAHAIYTEMLSKYKALEDVRTYLPRPPRKLPSDHVTSPEQSLSPVCFTIPLSFCFSSLSCNPRPFFFLLFLEIGSLSVSLCETINKRLTRVIGPGAPL